MCGRTACTLAPDAICTACGYQASDGRWVKPMWTGGSSAQTYYPSYNLAPTTFSPVLLWSKHMEVGEVTTEMPNSGEAEERVLRPMRWGLIPSWYSGDLGSFQYTMNNARSDGMLAKASFKRPLQSGRRCVVLADGYYEWHRSDDGKKQPYFIYFPSSADHSLDGNDTRSRPLLTMAGVFDVWKSQESEEPLYSYAVITVDAHGQLAWMHDRMPAILKGDKEVKAWLDYESVPLDEAVKMIRPTDSVVYHPVSVLVNNSRNNSEDCIKPITLHKEESKPAKSSSSSNMMKSWLSTSATKRSAETSSAEKQNADKMPKTE